MCIVYLLILLTLGCFAIPLLVRCSVSYVTFLLLTILQVTFPFQLHRGILINCFFFRLFEKYRNILKKHEDFFLITFDLVSSSRFNFSIIGSLFVITVTVSFSSLDDCLSFEGPLKTTSFSFSSLFPWSVLFSFSYKYKKLYDKNENEPRTSVI